MDSGLYRRIIDECLRHGTAIWLQYMGEPLMHPQIIEMISMAKNAGIEKVGLSTNAFFLDQEMGQGIVASGLDRLECSVDAVGEEEFQEIRGSPYYGKITQNIQNFFRHKKEIGAIKPVTSIQYMSCSVPSGDRESDIIRSWKDWLGNEDFIMSIRDYSFAGTIRRASQKENRLPCQWIFRYAVILWDGTMVMCGSDFDGQFPMGNVNQMSIVKIWKGAEFEAVRELHRSRSWSGHHLCNGCDDWAISDGSGYVNILQNKSE
jgi:radical SAM protein with 4Fe4S-binding SPASM domain